VGYKLKKMHLTRCSGFGLWIVQALDCLDCSGIELWIVQALDWTRCSGFGLCDGMMSSFYSVWCLAHSSCSYSQSALKQRRACCEVSGIDPSSIGWCMHTQEHAHPAARTHMGWCTNTPTHNLRTLPNSNTAQGEGQRRCIMHSLRRSHLRSGAVQEGGCPRA